MYGRPGARHRARIAARTVTGALRQPPIEGKSFLHVSRLGLDAESRSSSPLARNIPVRQGEIVAVHSPRRGGWNFNESRNSIGAMLRRL